jgi:ferritin-like metal-binding protein YciE
MKTKTLRDLFVEELKDLYDAENRLVRALPKLARVAHSDALRAGFEEHLKQTREPVQRLREIFT